MPKTSKEHKGGLASFMISTPVLALSAGLMGGTMATRNFLKQIKPILKAKGYNGTEKVVRALKRREGAKVFAASALTQAGVAGLSASMMKKLHLTSIAERRGGLKKYEREALKGIRT
jgi:hypothetical protein